MAITRTKLANNSRPWTAYTPVLTNVTIGNGSVSGFWRRVGQNVEIEALISFDSTTSVSGTIEFEIPQEFVLDESKLTDGTGGGSIVGTAKGQDGTNKYTGLIEPGNISGTTGRKLRFAGPDGQSIWNATVPFSWGTSDRIQINASVPVQEFLG